MDNKILRMNGSGDDLLLKSLEFALMQEGAKSFSGFIESATHGLILIWGSCERSTKFLVGMSAQDILPIVSKWLKSDFAKSVELGEWCEDIDHDGSSSEGFLIYCEDWGHVGESRRAICAVKPSYLWHGK